MKKCLSSKSFQKVFFLGTKMSPLIQFMLGHLALGCHGTAGRFADFHCSDYISQKT